MVGEGKLHCIFKPANLNFLLVYNHQYTESSTLLHKHTLYVYHTATSVVVMTTSGILGQKTEVCTTSDKMTLSMHFCHHPGTMKILRSHWPPSFGLVHTQWG